MKYQDLVENKIREVIFEHGNNSNRRDIKVVTDNELSQYKFDKVIGQTAYYTRVYASPYV
jgi:hypothetical protein